MRRNNKDINVFNMSALDLFASALGAFIVITVVLFPYYLKESKVIEQLKVAKIELTKTQQQLQQCQKKLKQANKANANCLKKLSQTFLIVIMKWSTIKHDVDLHVVTPEGNEFYYDKNNRNGLNYSSSNAVLSVDTKRGPGFEMWEEPTAKSGEYKIFYRFFARHNGVHSAKVSGSIYFRGGSKKLPLKTLSRAAHTDDNKILVATIIVNDQGEVTIR